MSSVATPLAESDAPALVEPVQVRSRPRLSSVIGRLTAANLAFMAATVVTSPLQARALGPSGRGELAAIAVPLGLAPIILTLGLSLYTFRAAAQGKRPGSLLGTIGALFLLLGLVGAAIGPLVGELFAGGRAVVHTWLIVGFALLPISFVNIVITDVAAGQDRWGPVLAYRLTAPAILLVGIVGLYIAGHLTVGTAALLSIAGGTLPVVFLVPGARRFRPLRFEWPVAREAIPFGLKAWAAGLGSLVNVRFDQLLMTRLVDSSELGLYVIAVTASGVLVNPFVSALASGTMPRFATGTVDLVARVLRSTLLGVVVVSVGVALAAPVFVPLVFGSGFRDAVPMIWILLLAGVPLTGGAVLSSALASSGLPGYAAWGEFVAIGVTVPGLILLLPQLGGLGAALVSLVAYSASFAMLLFATRRKLGAHLSSLLVIRPSDAATLMANVRSRIPERLRSKLRGLA
jgi:O-antigen/teichoic acid export membrane protein